MNIFTAWSWGLGVAILTGVILGYFLRRLAE